MQDIQPVRRRYLRSIAVSCAILSIVAASVTWSSSREREDFAQSVHALAVLNCLAYDTSPLEVRKSLVEHNLAGVRHLATPLATADEAQLTCIKTQVAKELQQLARLLTADYPWVTTLLWELGEARRLQSKGVPSFAVRCYLNWQAKRPLLARDAETTVQAILRAEMRCPRGASTLSEAREAKERTASSALLATAVAKVSKVFPTVAVASASQFAWIREPLLAPSIGYTGDLGKGRLAIVTQALPASDPESALIVTHEVLHWPINDLLQTPPLARKLRESECVFTAMKREQLQLYGYVDWFSFFAENAVRSLSRNLVKEDGRPATWPVEAKIDDLIEGEKPATLDGAHLLEAALDHLRKAYCL